ncbi:MAG: acyl-CoA dehydrogenase family protein, partial [Paracoccaceae bacterium]|nr:acyl-CoA dehydrogenase family protein [Paracoccaceae bacterium]
VIAPLNAVGDRQHAQLVNGRVRMPDGFVAAYAQLAEDGWQGLTAPEAFGGMGASPLIAAGVSEVFSGANHALQMVCNLVPGAIATLMKYGTLAQQSEWIAKLASGAALST